MTIEDDAAALAAIPTKPPRTCSTCRLPADLLALVEADRASDNPHSYPTLSSFLFDRRKIRIGPSALRDHFLNRHHLEGR